jgi:transposase
MIRGRVVVDLNRWIADAGARLLVSFVRGIQHDLAAVRAAITESWSNGQTDGQVNKLKLVKRQIYGLAKIDLSEAGLLGTA